MADYLIQGGTLQQIANAIRTKGGASGLMNAAEMPNNILAIPTSSGGETQEKTVDPALAQVVVTPDQGYTLSKVTVNAIPQTEQAAPTLENNGGTITATVTQTAGYVQAGSKTATLELDKQIGAAYDPALEDQFIPANKYLTGPQKINAVTGAKLQDLDADFVPGNIKKDVDLFGVVGTFEGEGASVPGYSKMEVKTITLTGGSSKTISLDDSTMVPYRFYMWYTGNAGTIETNYVRGCALMPYSNTSYKIVGTVNPESGYSDTFSSATAVSYASGQVVLPSAGNRNYIGEYTYIAIGN